MAAPFRDASRLIYEAGALGADAGLWLAIGYRDITEEVSAMSTVGMVQEYLDAETGSFVRRGRRETLEFKGLWAGESPALVLYRSPLTHVGLCLIFVIVTALAIVMSAQFPATMLHLTVVARGESLVVPVPLLGVVPLALFCGIARSLLNYRYILTPYSIIEERGIVGLRLVRSELPYGAIREVVVYQDPTQGLFNFGDIQIGSDRNEEALLLRGIHHPLRLKLIIRERINVARAGQEPVRRRANDAW